MTVSRLMRMMTKPHVIQSFVYPFRKQLLAQFTGEELRHHLTREEYGVSAL